jgi:transposase-like protein
MWDNRHMVTHTLSCPFCQQAEPVIRHGTNRGGTARFRCRACHKTFTPHPTSRQTTSEMEARIVGALQERLAQRAIARMLKVSRNTIRKVVQKRGAPCPP